MTMAVLCRLRNQSVMLNPVFTNTAGMDKSILRKYLNLPQMGGKTMVTYIWIDGTGESVRGKSHIL